jgi:hypothetical protein
MNDKASSAYVDRELFLDSRGEKDRFMKIKDEFMAVDHKGEGVGVSPG